MYSKHCLSYHIWPAYSSWQIIQQAIKLKLKLQRKPQKKDDSFQEPVMSNFARQGCHVKTWRRTALIAKELTQYHINIATLSETKLADDSMLREAWAGYNFFWWGKPADEDRVGLALRTSLMKDTPSLPVRIMNASWSCTSHWTGLIM